MIRIAPSSAIGTAHNTAGLRRGFLSGLLRRLIAADRTYREMRELERLDSDRLQDIGLSGDDLDTAFKARFGRERQRPVPQDYNGRYPS
jgi:uncharacterized protein YjiS (DUF1127 family)